MDEQVKEFSSRRIGDPQELYLKAISAGGQFEEFSLGKSTSRTWNEDPKLLLFVLSRYKFVAKMLSGLNSVLEVGCQEGFGARLVQQTVHTYKGVDFYVPYIDYANRHQIKERTSYEAWDMLDGPIRDENGKLFDACFALDVLEHINPQDEEKFMLNCLNSIDRDRGQMIVGFPSLESQEYASISSKIGHVNCKSGDQLKNFMLNYFKYVYVFSMNDEVLHTGFFPMSHYVMAIGAGPIN
jgi:hypothetical protein